MNLIVRNISVLLFTIFLMNDGSSQDTGNAKFDQGVRYYSSGSYQEALDVWTEIYNTGYRSASLNYNIANAYFKLKDIPNSILFYERAYLLDPADDDINYNLQIARTLIVDRFQEIPELFFIRWYNFFTLILPSNNWAVISIISFILCLVFLSLYIYSLKYHHKVIGFWLAILLLIITVSTLFFSASSKHLIYDSNEAIVFSPVVSGKSSPDSSGTDLFVLHEGTKVYLEDKVGEWFEIRLSDGNKGWIHSNNLKII